MCLAVWFTIYLWMRGACGDSFMVLVILLAFPFINAPHNVCLHEYLFFVLCSSELPFKAYNWFPALTPNGKTGVMHVYLCNQPEFLFCWKPIHTTYIYWNQWSILLGWKLALAGRNFEWASKMSYYFNTIYGICKQIVGFGSCWADRQKS